MQTFLPYPNFKETAKCLDRQRLGKQRVECLQILKALTDPSYGWQNHPAVEMWRGHIPQLTTYAYAIIDEWKFRGYNDSVKDQITELYHDWAHKEEDISILNYPWWLGWNNFHRSHQLNLWKKDSVHYSQFKPEFAKASDIVYIWPHSTPSRYHIGNSPVIYTITYHKGE